MLSKLIVAVSNLLMLVFCSLCAVVAPPSEFVDGPNAWTLLAPVMLPALLGGPIVAFVGLVVSPISVRLAALLCAAAACSTAAGVAIAWGLNAELTELRPLLLTLAALLIPVLGALAGSRIVVRRLMETPQMGWKTPSPRSVFIAWAAGCAATVLLVWTWHAVGLASRPSSAGYTYSQYLTTCVSWPFVLSFLALGGILGLAFQQAWAAALGLVTPLPAAVVIEFVQDRTSHNLLPFEFLFYWCPALILAAGGVLAGWVLRRAMMRWRGGPHFLRR